MTSLALGRRAFLRGEFVARIVGRAATPPREGSPSDSGAAMTPSTDAGRASFSLARLSRPADEVAPFRRRASRRAPVAPVPMLAKVDRFACLASASCACSVCVEHCPVVGAVSLASGRPLVDPDRCDGCGACERACPAPGGAIRVLPRLPTTHTSHGGRP